MHAERRFWFPAKRYGWGWGLPVAWQGRATLALYVGALLACGALLRPARHPMTFYVCAGSATVVLILILVCRWKGEKPGWHWGGHQPR